MFSNPMFNAAPANPASPANASTNPAGFSNPLFTSAPNPYVAPQVVQQPSTIGPSHSGPVNMADLLARYKSGGAK